MTNCGCSSGIQCPESGTVMPVTFAVGLEEDNRDRLIRS
jgi:hypothetical protein